MSRFRVMVPTSQDEPRWHEWRAILDTLDAGEASALADSRTCPAVVVNQTTNQTVHFNARALELVR